MMQHDPSLSSTLPSELFESTFCCSCGGRKQKTLLPSRYPKNVGADELVRIYKSSSDIELMDPLVQCADCGLVFLNPRPRPDFVVESYAQAEDETFISQNASRIESFRISLHKIARWTGLRSGARILDIGSAGGAFLKAAQDLGYQATGVEPNRSLSAFARKQYGVDLRTGTLEDQSFEPATFEAVSLWDVLEHVHQPDALLRRCHGLLKPNGLLLINFPDYGSMVSRLMGKHWPFLLGVHLYYFTRGTLTRLLEKNGFEVLRHAPHWQRLELGYILQRASAKLPFFKTVARLLPRRLAGLSVPYQLGQTLTLARKHG